MTRGASHYARKWWDKGKTSSRPTDGQRMAIAMRQNLTAARAPHVHMRVDMPAPYAIRIEWNTRVMSLNELLQARLAKLSEAYRASMRKAARTAGLHAFHTLGFKPQAVGTSKQHYTYLMDRLVTVGLVRLFVAEGQDGEDEYDPGNIAGAFKSGCDGAYDALVGYSQTGLRQNWLGHYADAKPNARWSHDRRMNPMYCYGQHDDSSNQLASDRQAMQVIYEFREPVTP